MKALLILVCGRENFDLKLTARFSKIAKKFRHITLQVRIQTIKLKNKFSGDFLFFKFLIFFLLLINDFMVFLFFAIKLKF
jgi:hypothetical protein